MENSSKDKKGSRTFKLVLILLGLVLMIGISGFLYYQNSLQAVSKNNTESIDLELNAGTSTSGIAEELYNKELIRNKLGFKIRVKLSKNIGKLKAGNYKLSKSMTVDEIINKLIEGGKSGDIITFTIPEGYEIKLIANKLEKENLIEKDRFLELVGNKSNFEEKFDFLKDLKEGQSLEGFLFPSTYEVYKNASEEDIIEKMLEEFQGVYSEDLQQRAEELNMDLNEVITLASIIERESRLDSERSRISGVFHNRLEIDMKLQSCATVQYILGERKEILSDADTQIPSEYNTYTNQGLPPAPIASPGEKSILAAVNPEDVDYLFFVLTGEDGSHTFTKTYDEHLKANPNK